MGIRELFKNTYVTLLVCLNQNTYTNFSIIKWDHLVTVNFFYRLVTVITIFFIEVITILCIIRLPF